MYQFYGKSLEEILESYQAWYDAGLSDKEISRNIRENYPSIKVWSAKDATPQKRPAKPQPGSW